MRLFLYQNDIYEFHHLRWHSYKGQLFRILKNSAIYSILWYLCPIIFLDEDVGQNIAS